MIDQRKHGDFPHLRSFPPGYPPHFRCPTPAPKVPSKPRAVLMPNGLARRPGSAAGFGGWPKMVVPIAGWFHGKSENWKWKLGARGAPILGNLQMYMDMMSICVFWFFLMYMYLDVAAATQRDAVAHRAAVGKTLRERGMCSWAAGQPWILMIFSWFFKHVKNPRQSHEVLQITLCLAPELGWLSRRWEQDTIDTKETKVVISIPAKLGTRRVGWFLEHSGESTEMWTVSICTIQVVKWWLSCWWNSDPIKTSGDLEP